MATINGNSNFPQNDATISSTLPGKRKRSESADESPSKFTSGVTKQINAFSQRLQNALPLLRKADQAPSLLNHPLTQSGEPSPKRPKYSLDKAGSESISSRIESGYYHSPDSLLADIDNAAASLIKGLQTGDQALNNPESTGKAINQITLFKQSLGRVCHHLVDVDAKAKVENGVDENSLPGGIEDVTKPAILTLTSQTDRGPKTLYSGLQRQTNTPATITGFTAKTSDDLPRLDSGNLPNGISATQVPPSNAPDETSSAKQKRAFGEVFRPHRSLKALEPPRPSRNATRGSSLGWVNPEELSGSERPIPAYKSDHRYTSLPTGSWLHYSVEASTAGGSDNKRRQRDRALSFGESRAEPIEDIAEYEHARTKALFQSAYSSFAPTIDNSTAVVPEKTRCRAWWSKVGQKRFQALLSLQYPEIDTNRSDFTSDTMDQVNDDFEAVVADFEEDNLENPLKDHVKDADPKEVDEILQEISDLLQTLNSYQRIRNLSKMNSGPVSPTSAEADVYEVLRSSLSILVNSLPPYAVAKLSGDQLEMLNVSTRIVVDTRDHVGTMEADEYSLQRQRVSMAATHPASVRPSVTAGAAGRPGNYNAQSLSYNPRLNYANAPRTPYSNQQPRPMPAHGVSGAPQPLSYPASRPAPTPSQRAGLPAQPHYSNQSYSQGPNASRYQRPISGQPNGYGPSYAQTINAQAYGQQRQNQSSYSYSAHQSPQKPIQSPQPVAQAQQPYSAQSQLLRNQASTSAPHAINSQGSTVEHLRNQLQAQRQLSGTPQTPHTNGQYAQLARSSTPGGGTLNGRPTIAAGSAGQ